MSGVPMRGFTVPKERDAKVPKAVANGLGGDLSGRFPANVEGGP